MAGQPLWNAADADPNVTLSDSNRTQTMPDSSTGFVRSTLGLSTGKYYVEFILNTPGGASFNGLVTAAVANTGGLTGSSSAWVIDGNAVPYNGSAGSDLGSTGNGSTLMLAVDFASGKLWWGNNGTWFNSGDPAAGTGAVYTNLTGTLYLAGGRAGGGSNRGSTLTTVASYAYSPPSGFLAGWGATAHALESDVNAAATISAAIKATRTLAAALTAAGTISGTFGVRLPISAAVAAATTTSAGFGIEYPLQAALSAAATTSAALFVPFVGNQPEWSPTNKDSDVTLSNSDRTYDMAANAGGGVISKGAVSDGKWYIEIAPQVGSGTRSALGIALSTVDLTIDPFTAGADLWYIAGNTGSMRFNGTTTSYGSAIADSDVLMLAYDADTGSLYLGTNGTWFNSGDPATDTNPVYTGITGSIFLYGGRRGGSTPASVSATFDAPGSYTYAAPSGFIPGWGSSQALQAALAAAATISAQLQPGRGIASALTVSATTAAAFRLEAGLSGSLAGVSTVSGDLRASRPLAGSVSGEATVAAPFRLEASLAAGLTGEATVYGDLTRIESTMKSDLVVTAEVTAGAEIGRGLAAAVTGTVNLVGAFDAMHSLAGSLDAVVAVAGAFLSYVDFEGHLDVSASVTGLLGIPMELGGLLDGTASVGGSLIRVAMPSSAVAGAVTTLASFGVARGLSSIVYATVEVEGELISVIRMAAGAEVTAELRGSTGTTHGLSTNVETEILIVGSLTRPFRFYNAGPGPAPLTMRS